MKKLLGIDLGTTKTGLARSDESGTLAFSWQTITGGSETQLKILIALVSHTPGTESSATDTTSQFTEIVFGLPSQDGEWKDKIQAFALKLKHALQEKSIDIPISFANEDFSSFDAQKNLQEVKANMKKKDRATFDASKDDAEAARLLLQKHLDGIK